MDTAAKKLFKTSVVGGFNRDDVFAYIESMTNQHTQEMQDLRAELKTSAAQTITAKACADELNAKIAELEDENKRLGAKISADTDLEARISNLNTNNADLVTRLRQFETYATSAESELKTLRAKLANFESMQNELEQSKSRIADLELHALQRADQVEFDARERMGREEDEHRDKMAILDEELLQYRKDAYAEISNLVANISSAYINVKSAVVGFKTGFETVTNDLNREIDTVSTACSYVERSFGDLCERCTVMRDT
ncbi:MAG: hypothetical protein RR994_01035, partial [Clostridia bacterium]